MNEKPTSLKSIKPGWKWGCVLYIPALLLLLYLVQASLQSHPQFLARLLERLCLNCFGSLGHHLVFASLYHSSSSEALLLVAAMLVGAFSKFKLLHFIIGVREKPAAPLF